MAKTTISIVSPVYNEEACIIDFVSRLFSVCDKVEKYKFEVILVNDGSTDVTLKILDKLKYHFLIDIVTLPDNVGQQKAILAGLRVATGDAIIVLDADLQDPPESIPAILEAWEGGADAVMCFREKRADSFVKKLFASIYYQVLHFIDRELPRDCGDYFLINKKVSSEIVNNAGEKPYLRGLVAKKAKELAIIPITRSARAAGRGHYSIIKMLHLASNGVALAMKKNEE